MTKAEIHPALLLAFEAGTWLGQVELEESMDKNSYFDALLSCAQAKKTGMPAHTVSMRTINGTIDWNSRPVRYFLRTDQWREGVKRSANEYLMRAQQILNASLSMRRMSEISKEQLDLFTEAA